MPATPAMHARGALSGSKLPACGPNRRSSWWLSYGDTASSSPFNELHPQHPQNILYDHSDRFRMLLLPALTGAREAFASTEEASLFAF